MLVYRKYTSSRTTLGEVGINMVTFSHEWLRSGMLIQVTRSLSSWFQGIFFRYSQWRFVKRFSPLGLASFLFVPRKNFEKCHHGWVFSRWWIDQRWAPWRLSTPFFLLRRIFQISRYHGCPNECIWHLKCIHYFQELSTKTRIFMCKRKCSPKKGVLQNFITWYFKAFMVLQNTMVLQNL